LFDGTKEEKAEKYLQLTRGLNVHWLGQVRKKE